MRVDVGRVRDVVPLAFLPANQIDLVSQEISAAEPPPEWAIVRHLVASPRACSGVISSRRIQRAAAPFVVRLIGGKAGLDQDRRIASVVPDDEDDVALL